MVLKETPRLCLCPTELSTKTLILKYFQKNSDLRQAKSCCFAHYHNSLWWYYINNCQKPGQKNLRESDYSIHLVWKQILHERGGTDICIKMDTRRKIIWSWLKWETLISKIKQTNYYLTNIDQKRGKKVGFLTFSCDNTMQEYYFVSGYFVLSLIYSVCWHRSSLVLCDLLPFPFNHLNLNLKNWRK